MEMYNDSSFIKDLSENNSLNLLVFPDEFVQNYGEILPDQAYLMTEEKFGTCWKVKLDRLYKGRVCFANGWPQFIRDHPQISESDSLVFRLLADAQSFIVEVFGHDGLKKPSSSLRLPRPSSPPRDVMVNKRRKGKRPLCTEGQKRYRCERGVLVDGFKSFTVTSLNKHHLYCLNIPMCFAEGTGIAKRNSIWLKNESGVSRKLKVWTREKDGRKGLMGVDWEGFWKENCLTIGNTVTFSIVGGDYGTLHMSREGLIVPTPAKKATGRPRKKF